MEEKICTQCKLEKDISNFSKWKLSKDGFRSYCKSCSRETYILYCRTKDGLFSNIYSKQKNSSKIRKHNPPSYTKEELVEWILYQPNFEELWGNWVNSGYKKDLRPSVDRLDDSIGYFFGNIQLVTWIENSKKAHLDMRNGKNTKNCKVVIQYDLEGVFINEYYSMSEASRKTNQKKQNISNVCLGNRKTSGGYIWKYK